MTEEIPATPGWVDETLDAVFAGLPPGASAAKDEYLTCLAGHKSPAAPSDTLGAEFADCRRALRRALLGLGVAPGELAGLEERLEVLEAEIAGQS